VLLCLGQLLQEPSRHGWHPQLEGAGKGEGVVFPLTVMSGWKGFYSGQAEPLCVFSPHMLLPYA
jgi:hypothetical protein